jgi:hypothetical protein
LESGHRILASLNHGYATPGVVPTDATVLKPNAVGPTSEAIKIIRQPVVRHVVMMLRVVEVGEGVGGDESAGVGVPEPGRRP